MIVLLYTVAAPEPEVEAEPSVPEAVVAVTPDSCAVLYVNATEAEVTVDGPLLVTATVNVRLFPALAVVGDVETSDRSAL